MEEVCPQPGSAFWCSSVMQAWSGGAFDTVRERLIVFGGGHADSPYNNVFAFDLPQMKWERLTDSPWTSPDDMPAFISDLRVEPCGLYPNAALAIPRDWLRYPDIVGNCAGKQAGDACTAFTDQPVNSTCVDDSVGGLYCNVSYVRSEMCDDPALDAQLDAQQPRSAHTYGNVAFSHADDRFYIAGSVATYPTAQTSSRRVSAFDFTTGQWSRRADNPDVAYGRTATDAEGNIWYVTTWGLKKYDPSTDSWGELIATPVYGHDAVAIDTKRNILAVLAGAQFDPDVVDTFALSQPGATHAAEPTTTPTFPSSAPGFEYDPELDRFVAWHGGRELHYLDPETWQWITIEGGGDEPGPAPEQGTYGRFRYSPACNVYVAVSSVTTDVFVFKPPSTAP